MKQFLLKSTVWNWFIWTICLWNKFEEKAQCATVRKNCSSDGEKTLKLLLKKTYTFITFSHCAFSSNLFHGQIAQIYIDQLRDPENKKCSPWKVFGTNHPQTLRLLSRRGHFLFSSMDHLVGRYIFELSARATNLMKKGSVKLSTSVEKTSLHGLKERHLLPYLFWMTRRQISNPVSNIRYLAWLYESRTESVH